MYHRTCTMSPVDEEDESAGSAIALLKATELEGRVREMEREIDSMRNSMECRTLAGAMCIIIWLLF